jgi:aspartate racemase
VLSAESHSSRGYGSGVRRIGLLGGMSWESSVEYERVINREVRARCGGVASADLVVRSLDFSVIEQLQASDRWEEAGDVLAAAAIDLERAGAEVIVLCTNTMHRVIDRIEAAVSAEVLHIADATAEAARRSGVADLALLGTRYTMEADFYAGHLPSIACLELFDDREVEGADHKIGRGDTTTTGADLAVDHALVLDRRLPRHAAEQTDSPHARTVPAR